MVIIEPLIGKTRAGKTVDSGMDQIFIEQTQIVGNVPQTKKVRVGYANRKKNAPLSLIAFVSEAELKEIRLALAKRDAGDDANLEELVASNQRPTFKPPPLEEVEEA